MKPTVPYNRLPQVPQEAVSNPDKTSETSDHQGEGVKPAAKQRFVRGKGEGVFQIRCSKLMVHHRFRSLERSEQK